jgi:nucleotide-binding universal stress UspA family protein
MKRTTEQSSTGSTHLVSDPDGVRYETSAANPWANSNGSSVAEAPTTTPKTIGTAGRIVVGIDGSEASLEALRRGIRIAHALGTSIEAVTSWRFGGYASVGGEFMDTPEEDARTILKDASTAVFGVNIPDWFTSATREGNADQVLIDASKGAEMLIVGSRGHGGIIGVLLGSVSAICAERASCPVLIVH